jgi:hypothetical protein
MYEEWPNDARMRTAISVCDTCTENSFRLSAERTIPCISAGGDRRVLHLAVLEKFCSALTWTVLTAHSIVLFAVTQ